MSAPVLTPERAAVLDRLVAEEQAEAAEQARREAAAAALEALRREQREELDGLLARITDYEASLPARAEHIGGLIAALAAAAHELFGALDAAGHAFYVARGLADECGGRRPTTPTPAMTTLWRAGELASKQRPDLTKLGFSMAEWARFQRVEHRSPFAEETPEERQRRIRNAESAEIREIRLQAEHDAQRKRERLNRDGDVKTLVFRTRPADEEGS